MNINSSKRKVSRRASQECSEQSIVSAMDRFVISINNMEDTVLVPSRLMDMQVEEGDLTVPQPVISSTDLHSLYNMLNNVKTELIWGSGDGSRPQLFANNEDDAGDVFVQVPAPRSRKASFEIRSSEGDSATPPDGDGDFESDSESSSESDSGMDSVSLSDESTIDASVIIATNFRRHLSGLFYTLQQLSDVSDYLTNRYQKEVGLTA